MITKQFIHHPWFLRLPKDLQQLISLSVDLYQRERRLNSQLIDYSFILFPASKAYEGFLKQYLLDNQLISQKTFNSRRFRIGRALNPDVSENQRDEWWLYDDVEQQCGQDLGREVWRIWLESRNHVFHYFPTQKNFLSFKQVETKLENLLQVMEALSYCTIPDQHPR